MDNMENQPQHLIYIAVDGDNIGKRHARALLDDNVQEISNISHSITEANEMVKDFIQSHGGSVISLGGDEGLYSASADILPLLEGLRKDYENMVGATLSIGVGSKPSEAGKALLAAKERGKNQIVEYDESAEQDALGVQEKRNDESDLETEESSPKEKIEAVTDPESSADMDEGVGHEQVNPTGSDADQNEPTLSEPHEDDNNLGYDSGYKDSNESDREDSYRRMDEEPPVIKKPNLSAKPRVMEAVSTDIQEVDRQMNEEPANPEEEGPMIPKPAPKSYHGQAEGEEEMPESQAQPREGGKPGDLKYIPEANGQIEPSPDIPIENATSDVAEETEANDMGHPHCPSCTCDMHEESAEDVLDQHVENAKDFENSLEGQREEELENPEPKSTEEVLDHHVSNATEMNQDMDEQGISRPADYNQKDGDLGLSEEDETADPELSEIFQGGLDQHADEIQKEKVVQMVGEALEGFKSQKAILDKAKQQAPELYDSCLAMLRGMIELCKLAGLDNSGEAEQEVNEIEGQGESPEEAPGAEEMPEEQPEMPQEASPKAPQSKAGS